MIDVGRLTLIVGGTVSWVLNCVAAQKARCTEGHRQATWLHLFLLTVDVVRLVSVVASATSLQG